MNKAVKIIIAVVVIGLAGVFAYLKLKDWHTAKLETAVKQEQKIWQDKADHLEAEISSLEKEIKDLKGQEVPSEKLAEAFGEDASQVEAAVFSEKEPPNPEEIERQILAFFSYLDNREYVQAMGLKTDTYSLYQQAVTELSENRPIVVGEMDSLYNMARNVAHFFRVLGKQKVSLAKAVMRNESEIMESMMKIFFTWYTADPKDRQKIKGCPSSEMLYQYAGFFLETLGGRSYLFRRDAKTRTLTYYYCVLIIDRANDEQLNAYGIDIRPHVISALNLINSQIGLIHQKSYIAKLETLKDKYRINKSS